MVRERERKRGDIEDRQTDKQTEVEVKLYISMIW